MTNTTPLPERSQIDAGPAAGHESTAAVAMASAKQVREFTGQAIGGVAPIGHPAPVRTVIDAALRDYETLWAAAGTLNTVMPLTFEQLVQLTDGTVIAVAAD